MNIASSERPFAVVTGASSGIGRALAVELARRHHDLLLVARRKDRLDALATELTAQHGGRADVLACDLAAHDGPAKLLAHLDGAGRAPTLFVNNAGFGHQGQAIDLPIDRSIEMVQLNVVALTRLTLELATRMKRAGRGTVMNIASTASFQPVPFMSVYGATKAFVLSFSEALEAELRGTGVRVFAACPGYIETEFQKTAGNVQEPVRFATVEVETFARRCLDAHERGARIYVDGALNKLGVWIQRVVPRRVVIDAQIRIMRPR